MSQGDEVWTEVVIRLTDPDRQRAAADKQRVMQWLQDQGIVDVVETYIDGIGDSVDALQAETLADDGGNHYPLAFYSRDAAQRQRCLQAMRRVFPHEIQCSERELPTAGWQGAWDERFTPFMAGPFYVDVWENSCQLVPSPQDPQAPLFMGPQGEPGIMIHAGHAFGTGQHRATRVLLRALSQVLATGPLPHSVLDVGTGTGIVAILAAKMGVPLVVGTELSDDLSAIAVGNAHLNNVTLSVQAVTDPRRLGMVFPVVVANILAPVLHDLMPAFAQCVASGGLLLLSGFMVSDQEALVAKASAYGFHLEQSWDEDSWLCLAWRRL